MSFAGLDERRAAPADPAKKAPAGGGRGFICLSMCRSDRRNASLGDITMQEIYCSNSVPVAKLISFLNHELKKAAVRVRLTGTIARIYIAGQKSDFASQTRCAAGDHPLEKYRKQGGAGRSGEQRLLNDRQ
jgi:hypothetical protein